MKNLFFYSILSYLLIGCFENDNIVPKTSRNRGYIYNINDSTPFRNTQFKVYESGGAFNREGDSTRLFFTDSNGYFDVTTRFAGGIYWTSYHRGAAYLGPQRIEEYAFKDSTGYMIDQHINEYKAYTKPWH
jgi:hypothetical protein